MNTNLFDDTMPGSAAQPGLGIAAQLQELQERHNQLVAIEKLTPLTVKLTADSGTSDTYVAPANILPATVVAAFAAMTAALDGDSLGDTDYADLDITEISQLPAALDLICKKLDADGTVNDTDYFALYGLSVYGTITINDR